VSFARIGVAGVGLIGGSLALAARTAGAVVIGFDTDPAVLDRARARGALDEAATSLRALANATDLLVLALPVPATLAALGDLDSFAGPVIDVASVKAPVVAAARHLPQFVGTHPLAGRERGGIDAADGTLFRGATWTLDASAPAGVATRIAAFIESLGAQPLVIDAAEHDRLVAATSHLPQILAVALGARLAAVAAEDGRAGALCGPGMRSMLRLAHSPFGLWEAILRANARPLARDVRALAHSLEAIAAGLEREETALLGPLFADAARAARSLEAEANV